MLRDSRRIYEHAIDMEPEPLLYAFPWWLDATCGTDGWEIFMFKDQAGIPTAFIPYHKSRIRGMTAIINPPLSQWLPVSKKADPSMKLSVTEFLLSLPAYSILDISFRPDTGLLYPDDPFPVHFKYSYIISSAENKEQVKSNYSEGLRRNLKEAEKNYSIEQTDDVGMLLKLCISTYRQRRMKAPPWLPTVVPDVYRALKSFQSGRIEFAIHKGKPIAVIMTGWDQKTSYYLMGGRTGDEGGASAHSLLLHNAIMTANQEKRSFDFEGSMHPGIANFFHSFGAAPEAYWQIRKFNGPGKLWSIFHP